MRIQRSCGRRWINWRGLNHPFTFNDLLGVSHYSSPLGPILGLVGNIPNPSSSSSFVSFLNLSLYRTISFLVRFGFFSAWMSKNKLLGVKMFFSVVEWRKGKKELDLQETIWAMDDDNEC